MGKNKEKMILIKTIITKGKAEKKLNTKTTFA